MNESAHEFTQTPENFHLLANETLGKVDIFEPYEPSMRPSSLREIYRLTSASNDSEVGTRGPAIAAIASSSRETIPAHQGLYSVLFGRDSLRVAIDLVHHYPQLAKTTVLKLAELQGTQFNRSREEEPGRIPHEMRDPNDPIARELTSTLEWGWPYYGSVDATPEFVRTLSAYCALDEQNSMLLFESFLNKDGEVLTMADALTSAVGWINRRMDANAEGLVEYKSELPRGIENQVWKDSWDAYHHSDGTIANHDQGIASLEVQVVAHEALLDAADLYEHVLDKKDDANQLRERASRLSRQVLDLFWTNEKTGYFVLGTDRDATGAIRQLKIRTSNMGHVLNSRLIEGNDEEHVHKRASILRHMQSPELLSVSGIRTLASDEVRYREGAYHNGSVWIWDTHHIAKGARRHKQDPAFGIFADDLDRRILEVVDVIGGFPEYVRGGDRIATTTRTIDVYDNIANRVNRVEQPPQEVQAWTVAAILATKRRQSRRTAP